MAKRKTREERATESFFRPSADFKKTTEKPVKEVNPEILREETLRSTTEKLVKDYSPNLAKQWTTEVASSRPESSELVSIEKEGNMGKKRKGSPPSK